MPIPRSLIRKMADDNTIYNQGLSLASMPFSHQILPTRFLNSYQVTATFSEENCHTVLEIDNESEQIENMSCSCDSAGICPHIVALLIKIENEFFSTDFARTGGQKQTAVKTDSYCKALISSRAEVLKSRALQRAGGYKVQLLPLLHLTKQHVRLGFKLGCKKAYIVKDLNELYQAVATRTIGTCGRVENFLYAPENFQNEALLRFFMTYYPLCAEEDRPKSMLLTPEALDSLMRLFAEQKLPCDGKTLTVTAAHPAFTLFIKASGDFYRLSLDKRDFSIYKGAEGFYILQEDTLFACNHEFSDACGGLLRRFVGDETNPMIAKEDMRTFYSMVLKPAARFISLESGKQDFIPPALKTKIYLDMDAGRTVTARTEFFYDDTMYHAFDFNRDLQTVWDIEEETQIEKLVKTYFPQPGKTPGTACFSADDDQLFQLVYEGIPALSRKADLYVGASLKTVKLNPFPRASLGVRMESNLLKLDVSAGDLPPAVLAAALTAYRQRKKYLRLKNGSFLLLETDTMTQLGNITDNIGLSASDLKKNEASVPAYRALYLNSVTEIPVAKDKSFTELARAFSESKTFEPKLPDGLDQVLRDYQKDGFQWLQTLSHCRFGGILADDMGLGKTLQVLSLLAAYKKEHSCCHALVICPASLVLNWEHEIRRFTPSLRTCCVLGGTEERAELIKQAEQADVLITSYDLLRRDISHYQTLQFDFQIIDEAQYIKNHNTQNARSVKAISAKVRFALTGTPIENTVAELWSIFDYLMPGYLYKYARFRERFEVPIIKDGDQSALSELKRMTAPFILRRLKRDVLSELPEKTETVLYTTLAQEQSTLYRANLASMKKELEESLNQASVGKNKLMVLAMLTRLRQLCCDPALLYENYKEQSAKLNLCMDLVESSVASGHKILIFSQFTTMLSLIEKQLKEKKLPYYLIEGATKKEDRLAQVTAFNQDDTPVFLISLKAGGTGLNLTGADVVIHYDPWWNKSAQNQATDRAHRIGQKNNVSVYKLIAKDTIEEKILELAEKKQNLADNVLPDEGSILQGLTKEQILDLFK